MSDNETSNKSAIDYEERIKHLNMISKPLASKKQTKKLYKLVKKATKTKSTMRGVKEVVKGLRKGQKGICVIAGDISPIDVVSHLPVLCEENDVPYVFTPSKMDLGTAAQSKRPTSCIMVCPGKDGFNATDLYDELKKEVQLLETVC